MTDDVSWLGPPVDVRALFGKQHAAFVSLLEGLTAEEWERPTVCPGWAVRDITAHVLGDHAGRLSIHRDGYQPLVPQADETLPVFLDRINEEWVTAARRISPPLLVSMLRFLGDQVVAFWQQLDFDALGTSVYWAGPESHPVWLDAARDFTEYWTHHQQVSEATGRPGLTDPAFLAPVLDTFMRGLPHTLRDVDAPEGTALLVTVTGPSGGAWTCVRTPERWALRRETHPDPDAHIELDADTAWRLCTRGITPDQAATRARTHGDQRLVATGLGMVSIIWSGTPAEPGEKTQERS